MQVCLLRHMPHSCTATEQTPHSLRPHGHLTRRLGKALRGVWCTATIEGLLTAMSIPAVESILLHPHLHTPSGPVYWDMGNAYVTRLRLYVVAFA